MPDRYDVVVVGGGTAGLVTASGCARLGRRVALIERQALGGDCLWTGCVPTKALIASAKLAHQMRHAGRYGLPAAGLDLDPRAVMNSMREARRVTSHHDDPERFRRLGIDVIEGEARFVSRNGVAVGGREVQGTDIVIATGSRTAVPTVPGLEESGFVDHASFLRRDDFPRSLLILGGGALGIEFAQMFRRFRCAVTVVEMLDRIVGREDAEVIARVRRLLADEGIDIRTSSTIRSVRREGDRKVATIAGASGQIEELTVDELFVASGRRGNTDGLDLEAAGVRLNGTFVEVDAFLQTSVPRIWACGDVHGGLQFTHVAAFEAVKLVRNMLYPGRSKIAYDDVPWAIYVDPEVAHIGMTEEEARAVHGDEVRVYEAEMADVDRAIVDRTTDGFVKIVCDRKGHILGGHLMSAGASSLIEVLVLARKKRVKIGELAQLVAPYPALADAIRKAASLHYEELASGWLGTIAKKLAAWSQ